MKERPILFSGPMVRAILDGRKTQTRRVIKPQPLVRRHWSGPDDHGLAFGEHCTTRIASLDRYGAKLSRDHSHYGTPYDRLWVRETWMELDGDIFYRATDPGWDLEKENTGVKWTPSIFMSREQSRITLELTEVRVQQLQEISDDDVIAEGIYETPRRIAFLTLWDSINAKRGRAWDSNPWVWALTFKVLT